MGLSFQGPTAPEPRRPRLITRAARFFTRLLLAAAIATILTTLAVFGLNVATGPAIASYLLQPFSLLLVPGALFESIDPNPYAFNPHRAVIINIILYTILLTLLLPTRRPRP